MLLFRLFRCWPDCQLKIGQHGGPPQSELTQPSLMPSVSPCMEEDVASLNQLALLSQGARPPCRERVADVRAVGGDGATAATQVRKGDSQVQRHCFHFPLIPYTILHIRSICIATLGLGIVKVVMSASLKTITNIVIHLPP